MSETTFPTARERSGVNTRHHLGYRSLMKRRTLMKAGGLSLLAATPALAARRGDSAPVRLGLIGAGSRGQELARLFARQPGVSLVAACDVYPPRFGELEAQIKAPFARHEDYRALLDRKDLDAVIVATPLYLHAPHVVAVLESGRHVYAEKSLGLTVADCHRIASAASRSKALFQIGHQFRYASWYQEAVRRVRAGEIGKVTHIDAYWHRNHNWRRHVPGPAGKPDPKLERLINWRLYREYSGGLMAELGSHNIDLANWVFEGPPESVIGTGGIDHWRDGREVNDNVKVIFRYPKGQTFTFSAISSNAQKGFQQWIFGTRGSIRLTQDGATVLAERGEAPPAVQKEDAGESGAGASDADAITGASYLPDGENPGGRTIAEIWRPRQGLESDVTYQACRAFIDCVRKRETPFADARVALASGLGAAVANQAIDEGRQLRFEMRAKPT